MSFDTEFLSVAVGVTWQILFVSACEGCMADVL